MKVVVHGPGQALGTTQGEKMWMISDERMYEGLLKRTWKQLWKSSFQYFLCTSFLQKYCWGMETSLTLKQLFVISINHCISESQPLSKHFWLKAKFISWFEKEKLKWSPAFHYSTGFDWFTLNERRYRPSCRHIAFRRRSRVQRWVTYGRLKTKENFKLLAIKVAAVAYERWSFTRGSKYRDLTCKLLVFWKTGRLREVVATGGSTVFTKEKHIKPK